MHNSTREDRRTALDAIRASHNDVIDDPERLDALRRLGLLDEAPEKAFDDIIELLRLEFDVGVARIHLLDDAHLHIRGASDGTAGTKIPVRPSMCQYTINQTGVLIIPDLDEDPEFAPMNLTAGGRPVRFYAGAPLITRDGQHVGSLCLLDSRPRQGLEPQQYGLLTKMAELTSHLMELRHSHADTQEHLVRAVDQDAITGLLSRQGASARLQQRIETAGDGGAGVSIIEFRVGRIDLVSSGFGQAARNKLMRELGERLSDTATDGELTARADEAGFLLLTGSDAATRASLDQEVEARARTIVANLARPIDVGGELFHPEICAGIARVPPNGRDAHELLNMAHDAAVRVSQTYGDTVGWPDPDAIAAERDKLSLEGRLRQAVEQDQLRVHYQPIVAVQEGNRIVGAEALLRWPQPKGRDPIGPATFIPLAEELGLMHRIGNRVFELSCQQLRSWLDETCEQDFWVSVNLAPQQLQDRELARRFINIAHQNGVSPRQVKLEITESAITEAFETVAQVIDELDQAGFALALDDFGTGHSSLARLINMPFDVLKVDRSFVAQGRESPGAAVVSSLRQLTRSLRLNALAEGVETAEHDRYLHELGYELAQGYYYSKPLDAEAFAAWRRQRGY